MNKLLAKNDALLAPLLLAESNEEADACLSQLITAHIEPVIKGVIRYKLHLRPSHAAEQAEAADIRQEIIAQLLVEIDRFRRQPEAHSIGDLCALSAVIAHRACAHWMRRQFPERHALRNRLHYLLTRQRGFALWQNEDRRLIAGFALWQGRRPEVAAGRLDELANDERIHAGIESRGGLSDLTAAIFNRLGGPVEFDRLVGAISALLQIREQPVESADDENAASLVSPEADIAWQVEKRIFLQRLWEEMRLLPLNQRAALLLNLKDAEGRGCIALFTVTNVATLRELAEALEMKAEILAELWNKLPLEDAKIAELLKLTRQQVINVRKSARERLARRLRGFI